MVKIRNRHKMMTPVKMSEVCEVFYSDHPCPTGRGRGAWSHNAILSQGNLKRRFQCHEKSSNHLKLS